MNPRRAIASAAILALSLLAGSVPASGQDASRYFTVMHPTQFVIDWGAFYRQGEARTAQTRAALPHVLDVPYGPDPKEKLDLYMPASRPAKAPVFLFLHGGGFREGDRAQYGFIAAAFAKHGVITAVASYRLTGDGFKYPDQPQDARLALKWLSANVAQYGGDPLRLYMGGHSAGAILSGDLGADRAWMAAAHIPKGALRGIAPVSGLYDLRAPARPGEGNVYAPTPDLAARASPLLHITDPVPEAVIAVGDKDSAASIATSQAFAEKMKAAGVRTKYLLLPNEDHKDTVLALADDQSDLFKAVIGMIEGDRP